MANIFYNSANGHYYEFVPASGISWSTAKTLAEQRTHNGLTGYLATATTLNERNFIDETVFSAGKPGNVYVGGSDSNSEGVWRWVTGPESLVDGGKGLVFFDGVSRSDIATSDMWFLGISGGVPVGDSSSNDYLYM
ncbi:MAG: hypothetical protein EBU08_22090, partial [Micrococcales bacterium]|nr:hypothetical protein [Micrococcales bacterium]